MTGAREVLIREASGGRSTAALWLISEDSHLTSGAITGPLIRFPSRRGDRSRHPGLGGMSPASDRLSRVDSGPCLAHLNEQVARKAVISNMVGDDQNWAGGGLSALGYRFSKADIGVRCVDGSFVAASGDQIVRASGEPRPCSGGSRRRTSLRDSAPRGRSPASGSRSAPTGARRRRSARRSRSQGRHR